MHPRGCQETPAAGAGGAHRSKRSRSTGGSPPRAEKTGYTSGWRVILGDCAHASTSVRRGGRRQAVRVSPPRVPGALRGLRRSAGGAGGSAARTGQRTVAVRERTRRAGRAGVESGRGRVRGRRGRRRARGPAGGAGPEPDAGGGSRGHQRVRGVRRPGHPERPGAAVPDPRRPQRRRPRHVRGPAARHRRIDPPHRPSPRRHRPDLLVCGQRRLSPRRPHGDGPRIRTARVAPAGDYRGGHRGTRLQPLRRRTYPGRDRGIRGGHPRDRAAGAGKHRAPRESVRPPPRRRSLPARSGPRTVARSVRGPAVRPDAEHRTARYDGCAGRASGESVPRGVLAPVQPDPPEDISVRMRRADLAAHGTPVRWTGDGSP